MILSAPLLILGVVLILFGSSLIKYTPDNVQPTAIQVQLIINYEGYAQNEEYNLTLPSTNHTVYDAMILTNLSLETTGTGPFLFIVAINGIRNNHDGNNRWWQYWVDRELAPVGVGIYVLQDDTIVEWRYTHPQML